VALAVVYKRCYGRESVRLNSWPERIAKPVIGEGPTAVHGTEVTKRSVKQLQQLPGRVDIPVAGGEVVEAARLSVTGCTSYWRLGRQKLETGGPDPF
jgi:hypothetical protein